VNQRKFPFKLDGLKKYSSATDAKRVKNSERIEPSMTLAYQNCQWGHTPSMLGDAKTTDDLYKIAGKLGYVALMEMTCRTGRLEVYTYRAPGPQQFSFMCLLHISRFCYSVLVTDLVSLLKLLDEIDAHLKEQVVATNSQKAEQTVNNARNAKGVNG